MSPKAVMISDMLDTLEDSDYDTIVSYIQLLSKTRKKEKAMKTFAAMEEFENILGEDRGWDSEEDMLQDMVSFRKERMGI